MTYEDLASLRPGDSISLDLCNLWVEKFDMSREDSQLSCDDAVLTPAPNDEDSDPWEDPYLDIYTAAGPVACDGETCQVLEVDADAEVLVLRSDDYDADFRLAFEDAQYCF